MVVQRKITIVHITLMNKPNNKEKCYNQSCDESGEYL